MPPSLHVLKGVKDAPDCRIIIEDQEKKKRRREEQIGEPRLPDISECASQYSRAHSSLLSRKGDGKVLSGLIKKLSNPAIRRKNCKLKSWKYIQMAHLDTAPQVDE